ncbi:MAG: LamG-like jellyroll fold domain-containing protein [Bacteroidota bacterium]
MTGITKPFDSRSLGTQEVIRATVLNLGDDLTEDFDLQVLVTSTSGATVLDTTLVMSGPWASLTERETPDLLTDFSEKGKYHITAKLLNANDQQQANDEYSTSVLSFLRVDAYPFQANLAAEPGGFYDALGEGWEWKANDTLSGSEYGWGSDVQGLGLSARESILILPEFVFNSLIGDPTLFLTLDFNLGGNDQLHLEQSTDGGTTWSPVPPSATIQSGWYSTETPYWEGSSNGPLTVYNQLDGVVSSSSLYQYRFRLITDGTQAGERVWINDLEVSQLDQYNSADSLNLIYLKTYRSSNLQPLETVELFLTNTGTLDQDTTRVDFYLQGQYTGTEYLSGLKVLESGRAIFSGFNYDQLGVATLDFYAVNDVGDTLGIYATKELLASTMPLPVYQDFTGIEEVSFAEEATLPGQPAWVYSQIEGRGRMRIVQNPFLSASQIWEGAAVLDNPDDQSTNALTVSVDAASLTDHDSLFLSFFWTDINDEEDQEDVVLVRGADTDPWQELYNWGANGGNGYSFFSGYIDIAQTLRDAGQSFSATTQIRFQQKDNFPVATDGLQLELIRIDTITILRDVALTRLSVTGDPYTFGSLETVFAGVVNKGEAVTDNLSMQFSVVSPKGVSLVGSSTGLLGPWDSGEARLVSNFTTDFSEKGKYVVTAALRDAQDDLPGNDSKTITVLSLREVSTYPFFTSFSTEPEGFYDRTETGWSWMEGQDTASSTNYGWASDAQGQGLGPQESILNFPTFDLTTQPSASTLVLDASYALSGTDQLFLEHSIDGGSTWSSTISPLFGNSGDYVMLTVPLDSLVGNARVDFRLRLTTDGTQVGEGVWLRSVSVGAGADLRGDILFSFDSCSSTSAVSTSGQVTANLVGNPIREAGYLQQGITLRDTESYVHIDTSASAVYTDGMMVALWLNPSILSQRRWIVGRNKEGQNSGWLLRMREGIPELALPGVSGPGIYSAGTALAASTWQHVAFTFSEGTVIAYINGVESRRYEGIMGSVNANASAPITLGRSLDGLGNNLAYQGSLDELLLSGMALSASEISALANTSQNSVACGVDESTLQAAWNFDDCNANLLANSVTSNIGGLRFSGATTDTGYHQQALHFDGVNDYARLYDSTWTVGSGDAVSYSMWVYPTKANGNFETVVCRLTGGNSFLLALKDLRPAVLLGGLSPNQWNLANAPLALNQWSQITVSYGAGTLTLYVNGVEALQQDGFTGSLNFGSGYHQLGLRWDNQRAFSGRIDELRIFNSTLTAEMAAAEYTQLAAAPAACPAPTPVAVYPFNSCDPSVAFDLIGNSFGSLVGPTKATGYEQTGILFDGNDYVTLGQSSTFKLTGDLTVSTWVNTTQNSGTGVLLINNPDGPNFSYSLNLRNGIPELALGSGIVGNSVFTMGTAVSDGQWHHIAFTYGNGRVVAYLDGVQIQQWSGIQGNVLANPTTEVWMGGRAGKPRFFTGTLDLLLLYDAALTPAQVADLAALAQNSTDCPAARPLEEERNLVDASTAFTLYPNPTTGQVQLHLGGVLDQEAQLQVTNLLGQTVYTATLEAGLATHSFHLDSNLDAGIYLVHVATAQGRVTRRLVKQ